MLGNILKLFILETVLIITLLIVCLKLFFIRRKQKLTIENLNLYNQTLTNMYDGIRSLKHDYINFIQCLKGYTLCNDMSGVKEMVDSVYNESKQICNMEILNPEIINNPAVYNLLLNKYKEASEENVSMNVEVDFNLKEINLDTYTLCRLLGILVDNAIDAAKECEKKLVIVRFIKNDNYKSIFVENSYDDSIVDLDKIFNKGYSTKYDGHGLGLWKVKKIVENTYRLELKTSKNYLFTQELIIKDPMNSFLFSEKGEKIFLN